MLNGRHPQTLRQVFRTTKVYHRNVIGSLNLLDRRESLLQRKSQHACVSNPKKCDMLVEPKFHQRS